MRNNKYELFVFVSATAAVALYFLIVIGSITL